MARRRRVLHGLSRATATLRAVLTPMVMLALVSTVTHFATTDAQQKPVQLWRQVFRAIRIVAHVCLTIQSMDTPI